jgi:ABC-type Zn uptake system ZnuABC Zn-binding protein ZnuA
MKRASTPPTSKAMLAQRGNGTQIKIATMNINRTSAPSRIEMLKDFVRKHDIDVLFVQEITEAVLDNWWGYTAPQI